VISTVDRDARHTRKCKNIAANAPKAANRTEETLRKMAAGTVTRHGRADAAEDDLFGQQARGDEVPALSPQRMAASPLQAATLGWLNGQEGPWPGNQSGGRPRAASGHRGQVRP
jgi:hypothetical protein